MHSRTIKMYWQTYLNLQISIVLNHISFSLNDIILNGCGTKVYQFVYILLHSNSKKVKIFMKRHLYFSRHLIVNTNIKSYGMMLPIGQEVKMKIMMMSLMRDAEISQNYMRIQKYFYKFEKLFWFNVFQPFYLFSLPVSLP